MPGRGAESHEVLGRSPRPSAPRGRLVALAVVVALAVGLLVVLDQRSRAEEGVALDSCARSVAGAVARAEGRVDAMTAYVRPVLDDGPSPRLGRSMYGLVSRAARRGGSGVRAAAADCRSLGVPWFHPGLRARRSACLRLAEAHVRWLEAVARDGVAVWRTRPGLRC